MPFLQKIYKYIPGTYITKHIQIAQTNNIVLAKDIKTLTYSRKSSHRTALRSMQYKYDILE